MTQQAVTRILKACRKLVGHARGAGRRVAEALGERFGGWPGVGDGFFDLYALQLALADELETMSAELETWDQRCERQRERGGSLRRRRDLVEGELRSTLLRLKSSLTGAFDDRAADQFLHPVRRLAADPVAIQQQAARLHATLTDPALELPPPRPGVEIDLGLAAWSLEQPTARLAETLAELTECEAAACHAQARRDEERARVTIFADRVARFYRALCGLAEHPSTRSSPAADHQQGAPPRGSMSR